MNTRTKVILAGIAALVLGIVFLPRLVRRIDSTSTFGIAFEKAAALEAQYQDMTNAHTVASEVAPDHPTARLWRERRAALLETGYIETRELRMRHSLAAKGAVWDFFVAFQTRFPGVERSVRDAKSDQPVVVVTARKSDFGPLGSPWFSLSPPVTFAPGSVTIEFLTPSLDEFGDYLFYDVPTMAESYSYKLTLAGNPANSGGSLSLGR